jgi:hypothetical protein
MENQKSVSPSLQCFRTPAVLVKDLVAENNVTVLEDPRYTSDVAPADFYLFPGLKSALTARRFCDDTDIIRMRRRSRKYFHRMAFRNVSNTFAVPGRSIELHKRTILTVM